MWRTPVWGRVEIGPEFMGFQSSDASHRRYAQRMNLLPRVRCLSRDFQFLGNDGHLVGVAQAADSWIDSRHR